MFDFIAMQEGNYGTAWGPCFCPDDSHACLACKNAQRVDDLGLDWDEYYELASSHDWVQVDELLELAKGGE